MQYTLSLTTRMMTIAGLCLLLLCVLLFLLGVEIGKRVAVPVDGTVAPPVVVMPATPSHVMPAAATDAPAVPAAAKP